MLGTWRARPCGSEMFAKFFLLTWRVAGEEWWPRWVARESGGGAGGGNFLFFCRRVLSAKFLTFKSVKNCTTSTFLEKFCVLVKSISPGPLTSF